MLFFFFICEQDDQKSRDDGYVIFSGKGPGWEDDGAGVTLVAE